MYAGAETGSACLKLCTVYCFGFVSGGCAEYSTVYNSAVMGAPDPRFYGMSHRGINKISDLVVLLVGVIFGAGNRASGAPMTVT